MSLKSSLAVCMGIAVLRSPKCAAKAVATRAVMSGSLSVNGKRSNNSKSGSFGDLEAWHSATTMRSIASKIAVRVASLYVLTLS